jgi:hypothetical protein
MACVLVTCFASSQDLPQHMLNQIHGEIGYMMLYVCQASEFLQLLHPRFTEPS